MRALATTVGLAFLLSTAASAMAQDPGNLLIPELQAETHGLTRAWFTQLPIAGLRSRIQAIVPDDDLLLITTTSADLYALDAETGRLVWSAQAGDPQQPTLRPGSNGQPLFRKLHWKAELAAQRAGVNSPAAAAGTQSLPTASAVVEVPPVNNLVVAVVNGTEVYLFDRIDGRSHIDQKSGKVWKVELQDAPRSGPMVSDQYVYIPTANGHIEMYEINGLSPVVKYVAGEGKTVHAPVICGERMAWISDKGMVHITMPDGITPRYQTDLGGQAEAQLAVHNPNIFAANLNGDVFCIHEAEGHVFWTYPTGSPIHAEPVAIGDSVYVLPDDSGIFSISAATGHRNWVNDAPRKFLAASPTKLYTVDRWNRMLILDARAGGTLDMFPLPSELRPLMNPQTDRIYLFADSGMLQCLHETSMAEAAYYPPPTNSLPPKPLPPTISRPKTAPSETAPKAKADADNPAPAAKAPAAKKAKAAGQ